ncbi:MAG: trigger factor [Dehalococcoidales bacterium]
MKVTREKTENSQAFLTIEMEPAEVEESLAKSYRHLAKRANIPGFRKGKVPRVILERYLGRESVLEDALNHLLPHAYEEAIKEQKIEAIAQPHIEITQTDPVIFKVTVPLAPTVKLDDYHHIQATPETTEITEDDVAKVIEQLRHQQATWEPVERSVEFGDLVVLDINSNIEGKPFINQEGVQYQVVRDLPFPAPGFAEQLSGMRKGEGKEFKLQFPSDYPRGELAGKEPSFKVKVVEIKQEILPELNDDFARQVNPDFKTLASLREQVATNLRLGAEEKARVEFEERVIEAVVSRARVEFPPILIEMEIDRLINEQSSRLSTEGKDLEDYLKSINKTGEQLREELHPLATKRVTRSLVLGKVAEEEKVEVTDSEIDAEVENILKSATKNKEKLQEFLSSPRSRGSIKQFLTTRKTIQRLVEIAKVSDKKMKKEGQK